MYGIPLYQSRHLRAYFHNMIVLSLDFTTLTPKDPTTWLVLLWLDPKLVGFSWSRYTQRLVLSIPVFFILLFVSLVPQQSNIKKVNSSPDTMS